MMNRGQLPSYLTVIGVYSTMHLVHPNYCQITSTCVCTMYKSAYVHTQCTYGVCIRTCIHVLLFQVCDWWVEYGSGALIQVYMCTSGGGGGGGGGGALFYLLCSTGWQQLDIVLFVAWDTAGEKYGIPLGVVGDKSNKILNFIQLERMFWEAPSVPMLPCCQP